MDFLNKLSNVASETYKYTAEKTGKIAKEAKLKMKINENKSKIEDLYEEIGKIVYQKHVREENINIKEDIQDYCSSIDKLSSEIEDYRMQILNLKERKQCKNCFSEIDIDVKYCPNCGYEQKDEPSSKIINEKQDDDKEEVKNEDEGNNNDNN